MSRLVGLVIVLALGSALVVPLAETLAPILGAFAVFLLAMVGLGLIIRAPFGRF